MAEGRGLRVREKEAVSVFFLTLNPQPSTLNTEISHVEVSGM